MSVRWVALTTNDPAYTVSCNDVNQCHMMPFFCMGCSTKPIHYFPGEFSLLQQVSYFTFCLLASLFLLLLNLDFFPTWSMMNFAGHWFHVQRSCQQVIFSPSTAEMRKENQKLPSYNISSQYTLFYFFATRRSTLQSPSHTHTDPCP